jgi:hypothetical protein
MTVGRAVELAKLKRRVIRAEIPQLTRTGPDGLQESAGETEMSDSPLNRLVAEWRLARSKMGLGSTATVMDVAAKLEVDRGTAQRLNRISKLEDFTSTAVEFFPGVRAWNQILAGVERVLGADHPNYQTLALACDHYSAWINSKGGSRSAALRQSLQDQQETTGVMPEIPSQTARAQWVQASAEIFGYLIETRMHTYLLRQTPDLSPPRMDLASLEVLKNCRGKPHALPLAWSRSTFQTGPITDQTHRNFFVLRSLTSKPAPATLSTGNEYRHTVFVEPQWASMTEPLNLAHLHEGRGAIELPWGTDEEWFEFSTINRHPCRRLIIERVVCSDVDKRCVAALRVFRTHTMKAHEEPWFDRIPEDAPIQRIGSIDDAIASEPFAGYGEVMREALDKMKWDVSDLVVFRAVIENPIPLATYTVMFDPHTP